MNVFGWEQVHHFQQHILQELVSLLVSDTEISLFVRFVRTGKLRISRQYFFRMSRHFDFRNQSDVMLLCIRNQFTNIVLGIVPSLCLRVVLFTILTVAVPPVFPYCLRTPGSKLGQQVQTVNLVVRKDIHLFLYEFLIEEMARYIQHHSPIPETRFILDFKCRKLISILCRQLQQ